MKYVATLMAILFLLMGTSQPVQAAPYSALVVFGDSLSDAGQNRDTGGPAGATYRYTNRVGPTYQNDSGEEFDLTTPILLGSLLGFDSTKLGPSTSPVHLANSREDGNNWAVGGYTTDQILASITAANGSVVGSRTRDGYLVEQNFEADPDALYYLTGGGNDFLQGLVTSTATAQATAERLVDSVQALQLAGARHIMVWLLPDVGLTPALYGTSIQAFTTSLSEDFNEALVYELASIDAQVIPLNIPLLFTEVLITPGKFGLADDQNLIGTCFNSCFNQNPVYGINGSSPDPSKLLFNDFVHPTIAGQRLIADYAFSLLSAPWEISLLPEMALSALRNHQTPLFTRFLNSPQTKKSLGPLNAYVDTGFLRNGYDVNDDSSDGDGYKVKLGISYDLNSSWSFGFDAELSRQELTSGATNSTYKLNSYIGSIFTQYQRGQFWGRASTSLGYLDYPSLNRRFNIADARIHERGDTDGQLQSINARIGYDINLTNQKWLLTPFISADYARAEVESYSEVGMESAALRYGDVVRVSKRIGVGLQGAIELSQGTILYGETSLNREYEDDATHVDMTQRSLPLNGYKLEGYTPDKEIIHAGLGISHRLKKGIVLQASSHVSYSDNSTQCGFNLSLSKDY